MTRHIPPQPDLNLRARLACALAVQGAPHAIVSGVVDLRDYIDAVRQAKHYHRREENHGIAEGLTTAEALLCQEGTR